MTLRSWHIIFPVGALLPHVSGMEGRTPQPYPPHPVRCPVYRCGAVLVRLSHPQLYGNHLARRLFPARRLLRGLRRRDHLLRNGPARGRQPCGAGGRVFPLQLRRGMDSRRVRAYRVFVGPRRRAHVLGQPRAPRRGRRRVRHLHFPVRALRSLPEIQRIQRFYQ